MLCQDGPLTIYMYQTGLETAVLGFDRAVVMHLLEYPGSLAVVPMYFRRKGRGPVVAGYTQETHFAGGTVWATA